MYTYCFVRHRSRGQLLSLVALGVADADLPRDRRSVRSLWPKELIEDLAAALGVEMQLVVGDVALTDGCDVLHAIAVRTRHVVPNVLPPALTSLDNF
mmetsp:Transcript_2173/g.1876  ORF Transcript_2173/g.1876 Transcript_2173/m.1876 type:complete len:97 (+) Transcript_2173:1156-1446(+)